MNKLTAAQVERLALLIEECAEVQQRATKILRFGYDSHYPGKPELRNNVMLGDEVEDLMLAFDLLFEYDDINLSDRSSDNIKHKIERKNKFLIHNKMKF